MCAYIIIFRHNHKHAYRLQMIQVKIFTMIVCDLDIDMSEKKRGCRLGGSQLTRVENQEVRPCVFQCFLPQLHHQLEIRTT